MFHSGMRRTLMEEVTLTEMLDARERRVSIQTHLLKQHKLPIICLTLNIPGPVKVFSQIPDAYDEGCRRIHFLLTQQKFPVIDFIETKDKTGYEAFFSVNASASDIKKAMVTIEDQDRLGRLFDIDVLDTDGRKLSREEFGLTPRLCLICDRPAHECSRSRAHSVPELTKQIQKILNERL